MTTLTFQNVKHILAASLLSLGLVACDKGTQSTEKTADTTQTVSSIEQIKRMAWYELAYLVINRRLDIWMLKVKIKVLM